MPTYTEVTPEVIDLAQSLIRRYHPTLIDARVRFVFQDVASYKDGWVVFATTSKVPPAYKVHLDFDFLIKIAFDQWAQMTADQREALIDHELCHCRCSLDDGALSIRNHDIEEFAVIIERHGLWHSGLLRVGPALHKATQLSFAFEEAKEMAKELQKQGAVVTVNPETIPVF